MKHLHLSFSNPFFHAAEEESLFRSMDAKAAFFLTYVNSPSVHVGRHQRLDWECSREFCRRNGISILRRISGGGAVYHDSGVLNYAFAVPRGTCPPDAYVETISRILNSALPATIRRCSRNSLWLQDRKISGSAFALTGRRLLVHGCILVSADLGRLEEALSAPPPPADFPGALRSVRSPVRNLAGVLPGLTPEKLSRILHCGVAAHMREKPCWISGPDDFRSHEQKFQDSAWLLRS